MDYDALTATQRGTYLETIRQTHERRVELEFTDLDGNPARSIPPAKYLGGSIQGDDTRTPVELFEATILDDDYALDWENGRHRGFKVQVTDSVFVPAFDEWVENVVFTGPLWDFSRTGEVVTFTAQGPERLAMGSVRRVVDEPRKAQADAVMVKLLTAAGVPRKHLIVPKMSAPLPGAVTVGVRRGKKRPDGKDKDKKKEPPRKVQRFIADREDSYYHEAARIAAGLNRDLYTDARERFIVAKSPTKPGASLTQRDLLAPARVKRGTEGEVVNTWLIIGKDPKGPKKQIHAEVALPPKHPLSAQSLAWHGTPYEVTRRVENPHLGRKKQAFDLGKKLRDQALRELVTYEVDVLPGLIPKIRPGMLVSVPLPGGGRSTMRLHQWTRTLGPDAAADTLGANKRTGWSR